MRNFSKHKLWMIGFLAAGTLAFSVGCGSPSETFGFHEEGPRVPSFDHPIVIAHPVRNTTVESPLVLMGDGTSPLGVVDYEVINDDSGQIADSGTTEAGSMGKFSKYTQELDLEPGNYTVTVSQPQAPLSYGKSEPYTTSLGFTVSGKRTQ